MAMEPVIQIEQHRAPAGSTSAGCPFSRRCPTVPRIVSGAGLAGAGSARRWPALAGRSASVLLVADSGLKPFGIVDRAAQRWATPGYRVAIYADIAGEPKEAQVEAARQLGKLGTGAKAVVCLGGGSALDAGKLAAVMLGTDAPVSDFRLAAQPLPEKSVPIVCMPTTAGTGSEMTGISVVSDASKTKFWFWGAPLEADLALLDPELTVGLPPKFTAMTGMDALVHAIEAATNRNAAPESDVAALPGDPAGRGAPADRRARAGESGGARKACSMRRRSAGSPSTRPARRSPTISATRSARSRRCRTASP